MAKSLSIIYLIFVSSFAFAFDFNGNWEGDGYLSDSEVQAPIHQKLRVVIAHVGNQLDLAICRIEMDKDHEPVCLESEYLEARGVITKTMTGEVVGQITDEQIIIDEKDGSLEKHMLVDLTEKNKIKLEFKSKNTETNHSEEIIGNLIRE